MHSSTDAFQQISPSVFHHAEKSCRCGTLSRQHGHPIPCSYTFTPPPSSVRHAKPAFKMLSTQQVHSSTDASQQTSFGTCVISLGRCYLFHSSGTFRCCPLRAPDSACIPRASRHVVLQCLSAIRAPFTLLVIHLLLSVASLARI